MRPMEGKFIIYVVLQVLKIDRVNTWSWNLSMTTLTYSILSLSHVGSFRIAYVHSMYVTYRHMYTLE
jgi:hypothetical protein